MEIKILIVAAFLVFGTIDASFSVRKPNLFGLREKTYLKDSLQALFKKRANQFAKPFERLPTSVIPLNYDLTLKVPLDSTYRFDGKLTITIEVKKPITSIVLNNVGLQITRASLNNNFLSQSTNTVNQTTTFRFFTIIPKGKYALTLTYWGTLSKSLRGFYRTTTRDKSGTLRDAAVTQFEPTDSRRALPCWDEPEFKATFKVTLVAPIDRVVISNMPVESESISLEDSKMKTVTFYQTPLMSTYLLAFAIGDYDFVQTTGNSVNYRVYTPVGRKEEGQFSLEMGQKSIEFFNSYFGIPYPLPKLDQIALADFEAGAMENWGLVTYRETALLVSSTSSLSTVQSVARVVAHELAHQWFGNLVTMKWWTHLWLNEGFASWAEYLATDAIHPEFDSWTQFVSSSLSSALRLDALQTSHPIEVDVSHPDEINEIFDSISYAKGASIIRMLNNYLGDQKFKQGINLYLRRHAYGNAETSDLWKALSNSSGEDVDTLMNTWTKKTGFPIITVESGPVIGTQRVFQLRQERFLADGSNDAAQTTWYVPLIVGTKTNANPENPHSRTLMTGKTLSLTVSNLNPTDWLTINAGGVGVFRVSYTPEMNTALMQAISDGSLPTRDRFLFISDLFALGRAGKKSTVEGVRVGESFKNESQYVVWSELLSNLATVNTLLQERKGPPAELQALARYNQDLLIPIFRKLGWISSPNANPMDTLLRSLVIGRLGLSGHLETLERARQYFRDHVNNPAANSIPSDIRSSVYAIVLAFGDSTTLDQALQLYRIQGTSAEEKVRLLSNLGRVENKDDIVRVLRFTLSSEVRAQDTVTSVRSCVTSALGRQVTWNFVKENWVDFRNRLDGLTQGSLVEAVLSGFASSAVADDARTFFAANPAPQAEAALKRALESIAINEKQQGRDGQLLVDYLTSRPQ